MGCFLFEIICSSKMADTEETPLVPKVTEMVSNKEKFTRYLEKEGVLEHMTRQLMALYEEDEKPKSALDYLKQSFGGNKEEVAKLKEENEKLQEENARLRQKLKALDLELKTRKSSDAGAGESVSRAASTALTTDDERMEVDNEKSSKLSKDLASDSASEQSSVEIKRNESNMEEAGTVNLKKERIDPKEKLASNTDDVELVDLD